MILDNILYAYTAAVLPSAFSFWNDGCSVGMWLRLPYEAAKVDLNMRSRDFLLSVTLTKTSVRVMCSHAGGLRAQARTKVPYSRWFHLMLTHSSNFLLFINGHAHALTYTEGPFTENQMLECTIMTEDDAYLILSYTSCVKCHSAATFADIQVLPCALTACEIAAIVEQRTCLKQLNMGRYLLDCWTNLPWYQRHALRCSLF